jgi:S1-C subfamily serine protease
MAAPPPRARPSRGRGRLLTPLLSAAAVVAVVLVVLATTGGSPSHKPASRASAPTATVPNLAQPSPVAPTPGAGQTSPATAITGRTINWLGMQVATVQGTGAVVQTVQLGTPADAAGLDPGDVIQTINGHAISTAQQITGAVRGLSRGAAVNISVARGSTLFTTVAAFDGHPTTSP